MKWRDFGIGVGVGLILLAAVVAGLSAAPPKETVRTTTELQTRTERVTETSTRTETATVTSIHTQTVATTVNRTVTVTATVKEEEVEPTVEFTLQTTFRSNRYSYLGLGGEIGGQQNPTIRVKKGDVVKITLINGDGAPHDFQIDGLEVFTKTLWGKEDTTTVIFKVEQEGEYSYFCSTPGHRQLGMEGIFIVEPSG